MKRKALFTAAVIFGLSLADTAMAQGAFDMGALTNTLSQDAARRQAQKRARTGVANSDSATAAGRAAQADRARATCANAHRAAGEGRQGAQLQQLLTLCARVGY